MIVDKVLRVCKVLINSLFVAMWAMSIMNWAFELWSCLVQMIWRQVLELCSLMLPDLLLIQLAWASNFPSIVQLVVIELFNVAESRH